MNALPRKTQEYDQVKIPSDPAKSRVRSNASITYLDDRRSRQLATKKKEDMRRREAHERMLQKQREYEEWKEIDRLYNPPKPQGKAKPAQRGTAGTQKPQAAKSVKAKKQPKYRFVGKKKAQENRRATQSNVKKKNMYASFNQPKKQNVRMGANGVAALQRTAIPGFDMNALGATKLQSAVAVEYNPIKRKEFASLIAMIVAVFLMLAAVLNMYATQSEAVYQNVQMENEIVELEKTLDKLKKEKASKEDLNSIQNAARDLGMHYPKEKQIVYLPPLNEIPQ